MDRPTEPQVPRLSREVLQPVARALHLGYDAGEQSAVVEEAVARARETEPETTADEIMQEALRAIAAEPALHEGLAAVDAWLEGQTEPEAAVELATGWSLAAAGLDLATAAEEARLYIDAYPFEGRIIGDLAEKCARWLAQRLAMVQANPAERLSAVRRSINALAKAASLEFPAAASSIHAVASDLSDDRLWYELALRISQRELASNPLTSR